MASSFFCPTSTTSFRPLVLPVQARFLWSIGQCQFVTGMAAAWYLAAPRVKY